MLKIVVKQKPIDIIAEGEAKGTETGIHTTDPFQQHEQSCDSLSQ